jgi:hypothetical protein
MGEGGGRKTIATKLPQEDCIIQAMAKYPRVLPSLKN